MRGHHYVYMAVLLIAGYALAMAWPMPGQRVRQLIGI